MAISISGSDRTVLIKWIITFALAAAVTCIPASEYFTPQLRLFFSFSAFFISILAFELLPVVAASMLLSTLFIASGLVPESVALKPWTNTVIFMSLGAFILANVMEEVGILRRICMWCISKTGGTYTGALYGFLFAGIILSILTFTRGYIIIATLAFGLCKVFGYEKPCKESAIIMIVAAVGAFGSSAFIYTPVTLGLLEQGMRLVPGQESTMLPWYTCIIYNWPQLFADVFFVWLLTKLFKTETFVTQGNGREYFEEELRKLGPLTSEEKHICVVVTALFIYVLLQPVHGYSLNYAFMVLPYLLFTPALRAGTTKSISRVNINVLAFMAACMSIGVVGMELGFTPFIKETALPLLTSLSPSIVFIIILVICALANFVLSASAMFAALSAPFTQIALSLNLQPVTAMMCIVLGADMYFLPHEITTLVVIFSFGMMTMRDFIMLASIKSAVTFVSFLVLQLPYWYLMGWIFN